MITLLPLAWEAGLSLRFDVFTDEVVVELLVGLAGPIDKQCWKGDPCTTGESLTACNWPIRTLGEQSQLGGRVTARAIA